MAKTQNHSTNDNELVTLELDEGIFTMNLDEGKTLDCKVLALLEVNHQTYIYLLPLDPSYQQEEGEFFIYRYFEDENEEISLENDLSDDEYEMAADAYDEFLDSSEYDEIVKE